MLLILALGAALAPVLVPILGPNSELSPSSTLPAASAVLAAVLLGWLALRPPRREAWIAGVSLALALATLVAVTVEALRPPPNQEDFLDQTTRAYIEVWETLEAEAAAARQLLPVPAADKETRRLAFQVLAQQVQPSRGQRGSTLLLVDGDGEAVAWAGDGLLHELDGEALPEAGRTFRAGFASVTLLSVTPLEDERRPWRLVSGRSLRTDEWPFEGQSNGWLRSQGQASTRERLRWSVVEPDLPVSAGNATALRLRVPATPTLVVEAGPEFPAVGNAVPPRLPGAFAGLALLALVVLRALGRWTRYAEPEPEPEPGDPPEAEATTAFLLIAAVAAWTFLATSSGVVTGALAAGLLLALLVLRAEPPAGAAPKEHAPALFKGAGAALVLLGTAFAAVLVVISTGREPADLAASWAPEPTTAGLRLALTLTALALLLLAGREEESAPAAGDSWAWAATGLLGAAAAAHDLAPLAALLLAAGCAAAAIWIDPRRILRRAGGLAMVVLLAVLASSTAWETAYRWSLRRHLETRTLQEVAPPSAGDLTELTYRLERHFARRDLETLVVRDPDGLDRQDLAFRFWESSPLARPNALSAVLVEPRDGPASRFALGLSFRGAAASGLPGFGLPAPVPAAEPELPVDLTGLTVWDGLRLSGEGELLYRGEPWGTIRWWLYPRPGYSVDGAPPGAEVEVAMLRRSAAARGQVEGLPADAVYSLYADSGRALLTPWSEAPPLDTALLEEEQERAVVETPAGRAWSYAQRRSDGWEVLYLPVLGPLEALVRVGGHGLPVLLTLAAVTLLTGLLALPRPAFRALLKRTYRSYSRRLLIAFSVLLLIPLSVLNVALITGLEGRLSDQQRADGADALIAAQQYLGEQLSQLRPGISIDSGTFTDLLQQVSGIIQRDVYLYWGSRRFAASRSELFSAGLQPLRIPGEIYSRLSLGGYNLASRTHFIGDTPYLELYAPVRVPGDPIGQERLTVSLPLLAQQEELARDLARLRRQSLLITSALFFLLVAVGLRLSRGFTRPITELVEGTRRIAEGAESLDLQPRELELAAVAEAVDEMARRIADGRRRLVREKQVVERMVDNVTSGIVSVDRDLNVLLRNRVAEDLLGVAVGERLDQALGRRSTLEPVARFVREEDGTSRQATVRLREAGANTDPAASGSELGSELGGDREWSLVWVPLPGPGEPSALLVVEDATEVLRGQRLEAWAEMARIIAHEIKNPLTPIRLSAEHMRQIRGQDPAHFDQVFERCTANILEQVDELQEIAGDFSTYSSILRISPKPGDLTARLEALVESYRAAPPPGVSVRFETSDPQLETSFDARLLGRAVRNLLENALRASAAGGEVELRLERRGESARITVADTGPGVSPELLGRIFDPYFSTHDTGTGLGLPIARRVAEEHGGTISAKNRSNGGLEVTITLPVTRTDPQR